MPNKTTVALTKEEYITIIQTMKQGGAGFRPNEKIIVALVLEANLGMRIGDILDLTPRKIIKDGDRYRLNVVETKTDKKRPFTVPDELYAYINEYCTKHNIQPDERIVKCTERNVQLYLQKVCDYLGYENISTHSFRKYFATDILKLSNYNISLVQYLLQHSSPAVTQAYIGITSEEIENALLEHLLIV